MMVVSQYSLINKSDKFQFTPQQRTSHSDEFSQIIETDVFDKSEFAGEGLWTSRKQKNIM